MAFKINIQQVKEKIESGENVFVLEALPEKYYDMGHLPRALNVPHDTPDFTLLQLFPDRDVEIITYCANEPCMNSEILADRLIELGYKNVADFHAGKEGWVRSGNRLTR